LNRHAQNPHGLWKNLWSPDKEFETLEINGGSRLKDGGIMYVKEINYV
jgi:hypothetical protein